MFKSYSMELAGRQLTLETGKMAGLANGSVLVRYGDTAVIVNVTASKKPREGIDFFPLSVDYEERLYAVGKIPGSFIKREGKPSDKAILVSRAIDRPIRPLFPKDLRNDVCVNAMVLSVDPDCSPEVAAQIGTSAALSISDIPFNGPTAAVSVGYVDGEIVINPTLEQRAKNRLNLTVAGTKEKVSMIEAGADEIPEDVMLEAIIKGHSEIKKIAEFIENMQKEIGKPKFEYESCAVPDDLFNEVYNFASVKMCEAVQEKDKDTRDNNVASLQTEIEEFLKANHSEEEFEAIKPLIGETVYKLEKKTVRHLILEEHKRVDGRAIDEIRPLSCEVDLLPRAHGSALFTRGQTQVLSVTTLGTIGDEQELDGLDEEETKRYIHHYNFPPYSVGEARPSRGPGRREIGHGALAERALAPVIPSESEFPYTIRVVSEVLSSNGSTSQGSICGSTLSLMAAGVPIKEPVAGISTGLVTDDRDRDRYVMLTDIQGLEDFFGDMDFKVAGTTEGITSIQVDTKIKGLSFDVISKAITDARKARVYILDKIEECIPESRKEVSKFAPKTCTISIDPEKIRDVIGAGGKVINKIIADTGVKIDIKEDGTVFVSSPDHEGVNEAIRIIEGLTKEVQVGEVYLGKVTKIAAFGAFVEILPNKEGLCHISKLDKARVNKVEDVVSVGDEILVKVTEIDQQGRINLSRKDALPAEEETTEQ